MSDKRIGSTKSIILVLSLVLLLAGAGTAWADVRLPAVIGDNMVLQRGQKVPIWGWAQPGEEITVAVSWNNMRWSAPADKDGKWRFEVTPPSAGGPYEMTVSGKNSMIIKNILVGEVWVCSGQSNMQMSVRQSANAEQEIAAANYPNIRLFSVQRKVAEQPQSDCLGSWQQCTPQTVADFSAVAYYFGRDLHKELGVPIGLIHTSWGGTPAEAWTSRQALEAEQDFAPILQRYDDAVAKYPQAKKEYDQKLAAWQEAVEKAKAEGGRPPNRPGEPFGPGHPHAPAGLYNAMIAPLIPHGIAGAIWYQGESNAGRAYQYRKLLPAMINNWRKDWGRGDFAFLIVQLANFMATKPEPGDSEWAELREAQLLTLALPNTGMAVIIDIGDANDIHPKNKQDVGKRLALWALAKTYGKNPVYSGPIYKSMKVDGNKVILEFNHVGGGLVAGGGGPLRGFAVAGTDRKFLWADAQIDGNTVAVSSDKVAEPVAVRYAWADNPVCNLYDKEGLPASPFRTDDWPGVTVDRK
jgi:sialate O-acetylesterase